MWKLETRDFDKELEESVYFKYSSVEWAQFLLYLHLDIFSTCSTKANSIRQWSHCVLQWYYLTIVPQLNCLFLYHVS